MTIANNKDFIPIPSVQSIQHVKVEMDALDLLERSVSMYTGKIAFVSSFGAESAILLHLVSRIDAQLPVLFVDTLMLFEETLTYQTELSHSLGLTNVQLIRPAADETGTKDRFNVLHLSNPDACCRLRKVVPLQRALDPYAATITGRKRFQSGMRSALDTVETQADGRIKINPLATWGRDDIRDYFGRYHLPAHPLVNRGYPSIGCLPCTTKVEKGEDNRAGRWRGMEKAECGIHFAI